MQNITLTITISKKTMFRRLKAEHGGEMRNVGIYMRVSSEKQVKDGESLEFQRNLLIDYIKHHPDMVLVDEYMDDGISGTKFSQRDELQRMLQDAKDGRIDTILFTKLDRFFRSVRHLMNTLDALDRYGVEWKAIQENHDNTTPTGRLALTIMGAFGEMEANMASVRVKDAFSNKLSKGEWLNSRPPFGYMIQDKKAVPDPEKAPIARQLFKEYIKHNSIFRLIRDHAGDGAPVSNKGMKALLKNRAYVGEAHGQKDFLTPLIDEKTFDTVQTLLARNVKSNQKNTYLFTGMLFCPECGRKMTGYTNNTYQRYKCREWLTGRCPNKHTVSERKLEEFLIERYKDDLEKRYLKLKSVKKVDNSQKINTIYRKMDRLKDLYVNELIDLKEYKDDLEKYRKELNELEKPQEVNTDQIEKVLKLNVYEIYHTLNKEQKRRLWSSVIKSITPKDESFFVEYL